MAKAISGDFKNILVIQLRQLGDVLLTTPALAALSKKFPAARVGFLVDRPFEPLLRHNPDLDLVLVRDPEERLGALKTIKRVREFQPDLVIDYLANPRTTLISLLSGAEATLSYANKRRSFLYSIRAQPSGQYVAEEKLSLLKPIGIDSGSPDLVFNFPESAAAKIDGRLKSSGISGPLVALDLFHKRPSRQWPVSNFIELADRLAENYQATVLITCLPENRLRAEQALAAARQKHHIASDLDLFELAALIRRVKLFIGGDAGPKHIAVSQKVPSFTILGPSGEQWTPRSAMHRTAALDLDCRPCGEHECPKPEIICQTRLSADQVWEKLRDFIESQNLFQSV